MNKSEQLANDPPLRAVRTFEAFARHGGVNAAARELDVSASAISINCTCWKISCNSH